MKRGIALAFIVLLVIPMVSAGFLDDFLGVFNDGIFSSITGNFHLVTGMTHRPAHLSGCQEDADCAHRERCVYSNFQGLNHCESTLTSCNPDYGQYSGECQRGKTCRGACNSPPSNPDATLGQACEENWQCGLDQRCLNNICVIAGGFSGERCNPAYNDCSQGKLCNSNGQCVPPVQPPAGVEASSCPIGSGGSSLCQATFVCAYESPAGPSSSANRNSLRCRDHTYPCSSWDSASCQVQCNPALDNCAPNERCNYLGRCVPRNISCQTQSDCGPIDYCQQLPNNQKRCVAAQCNPGLNNCLGEGFCNQSGICAPTPPAGTLGQGAPAASPPSGAAADPIQQKIDTLNAKITWLEAKKNYLLGPSLHPSTTGLVTLSPTLLQQTPTAPQAQQIATSASQLIPTAQPTTLQNYLSQIALLDGRLMAVKNILCSPALAEHHNLFCNEALPSASGSAASSSTSSGSSGSNAAPKVTLSRST